MKRAVSLLGAGLLVLLNGCRPKPPPPPPTVADLHLPVVTLAGMLAIINSKSR